MIASITSKGQVTVPISARRRLGLHAGSRVDFIINEHDHIEMIPIADSVKRLKGMTPPPEQSLTLDEMDRVISEGAGS